MNVVPRARAVSRRAISISNPDHDDTFPMRFARPISPSVDASTPDLGGARALRSIDRSSPSVESAHRRERFIRAEIRFDSIRSIDFYLIDRSASAVRDGGERRRARCR